MNKPNLDTKISIQDFKDYYWYKKELLEFCRLENLEKRGGKLRPGDNKYSSSDLK